MLSNKFCKGLISITSSFMFENVHDNYYTAKRNTEWKIEIYLKYSGIKYSPLFINDNWYREARIESFNNIPITKYEVL